MSGKTETAIAVTDAAAWLHAAGPDALFVDVREPGEHACGLPAGALPLPLARLIEQPQALIPERQTPVLLICAVGVRSEQARRILQSRGYQRVAQVAGGVREWIAQGLAMTTGADAGMPLDHDALQRYDRHLRLDGVGIEGQRRLLAARVLLVGAGGLGSPAAFYLAAAGVGWLRLVDDDLVERSNLQRQILHVDAAVGKSKVASARERLLALNPTIQVEALAQRLGACQVDALMQGVDVVIDGSDNFATRELLNAACVRLGKPLVYGAVERFAGQVAVFDAGRRPGLAPCYRCLFPEPSTTPPASPDCALDSGPNCAEAGVLGVLPGLVGMIQATEAIKLLLGLGQPLVGRLLCIDALGMRFRELALPPDPACPVCAPAAARG